MESMHKNISIAPVLTQEARGCIYCGLTVDSEHATDDCFVTCMACTMIFMKEYEERHEIAELYRLDREAQREAARSICPKCCASADGMRP